MRISDWRSDVCSSDLSSKLTIGARSACRCALSTRKPVRNWKIRVRPANRVNRAAIVVRAVKAAVAIAVRSEEHTFELQSLMRISYAVFCLKKKTQPITDHEPKYPRT